jgi:hypothetical protein
MNKLFTKAEMELATIPHEYGKKCSRSTRSDLDRTKVDLLKEAFLIKCRVRPDQITTQWELARKIANRHCYDIAKAKRVKEKLAHLEAIVAGASSNN